MPRLVWNERQNSSGIDRGVLFPKDGEGIAWNGLVSVTEKASELKHRVKYRDGVKVVNQRNEDSYAASIETHTYPLVDRVLAQGNRRVFGFSYRVRTATGFRIHLVYNALATPSPRTYTQDESAPYTFDISTTPIHIPGAKPAAHLVIDTSDAYPWTSADLEEVLYGSDAATAHIPTPEELFAIFEDNSIVKVTDNLDGTFTVEGPDQAVRMLDDTTFEIDWPSVIFIGDSAYKISSL